MVRLITRDDAKQVAAAEAIVTAIEMLLNHQQLTLQDPDAVAAAVERFRRRPAVGFSDCLILEAARKAGHVPLGTLDRDLGTLDGVVQRPRMSRPRLKRGSAAARMCSW